MPSDVYDPSNVDPLLSEKEGYKSNWTWAQTPRAAKVCEQYKGEFESSFPIKDKFSVMMTLVYADRLPYLEEFLMHYLASPLVDKIFLVWEIDMPIPKLQNPTINRSQVVFLPQEHWSINNRFNPINELTTAAILICDDDILIPIADIEFAFSVWQRRPNALVGFWPRVHYHNPESDTYDYDMPNTGEFTMLLTKTLFMRSQNLFIFTCLLPLRFHRYIDYGSNCEDIAINIMSEGLTGEMPVAVIASTKMIDFGTFKGISAGGGHINRRGSCVKDMLAMGNGQNFLPFSKEVVHRYNRDHANFKKLDWDAAISTFQKTKLATSATTTTATTATTTTKTTTATTTTATTANTKTAADTQTANKVKLA